MTLRSVADVQAAILEGGVPEFVFFWGHRQKSTGVSKSCFSQWYEVEFTHDGHRYLSAEHYMMAEKARLFGDDECYRKILDASNPGKAKALGREVLGFDQQVWLAHRFAIVVAGNELKFGQNPELKTFLLNTGDRILVEASPVDTIWGIGLAADDSAAGDPMQWAGENLLGFALMEVRDRLRAVADK